MKCVVRAAVLAVFIGLGCTGCAGYNWTNDLSYAEQRARTERKPLFVFYKWWLDNDSNRMIMDVLNQPEVMRLFQNTVNCELFYEVPAHREFMARHGVDKVPGFVIQAPDGSYQKSSGYIPKEEFIQWVSRVLPAGTTAPTKPPPAPSSGGRSGAQPRSPTRAP